MLVLNIGKNVSINILLLRGWNKRKYSLYEGTVGRPADNHIKRNFAADKPNKKWYNDATEFTVRGNKIYLLQNTRWFQSRSNF